MSDIVCISPIDGKELVRRPAASEAEIAGMHAQAGVAEMMWSSDLVPGLRCVRVGEGGMEVALDFAINCSPDHPYVHEHPDWFYKRPDGTIKYAENPPKKYQDVYPMNFHNADWRAMWRELASVIEFWCEHGVRIFRVDNPHTKPVTFWEYLITRVQRRWPDAAFWKRRHVIPPVGFRTA